MNDNGDARRVFKYALVGEVEVPRGAEILLVEVQHGVPTMWAEVYPSMKNETWTVFVHPTGDLIPPDGRAHLASYQEGPFVWHLYVKVKK